MAEITGYPSASRVNYQQSLQSPPPPREPSEVSDRATRRGVEVILKPDTVDQSEYVYERPKSPTTVELTPTQQRAIDDIEFEKRSPDAVIDELI